MRGTPRSRPPYREPRRGCGRDSGYGVVGSEQGLRDLVARWRETVQRFRASDDPRRAAASSWIQESADELHAAPCAPPAHPSAEIRRLLDADEIPDIERFADAHADLHRVPGGEGLTTKHRRRLPPHCPTCPETRPEQLRWCEPSRCKAR